MNPTIVLLILAVVGLLVYVLADLATNAKAQEAGRLIFACALLALCLNIGRVLAGLR